MATNNALNNKSGVFTVNEDGAGGNVFRVESDTNPNMIYVDGTDNRVGIGTNSPDEALDVAGSFQVTAPQPNIYLWESDQAVNERVWRIGVTNKICYFGSNEDVAFQGTEVWRATRASSGAAISSFEFNFFQVDCDYRFATVNQANMVYVDASTDRVGIATATPAQSLDVNATAQINSLIVNDAGNTGNVFRVESDTNANMIYVDGTANQVGIGTNSLDATFSVLGDVDIISANPELFFRESDQVANESLFRFRLNDKVFQMGTVNDKNNAGVEVLRIERGTGTAVNNLTFNRQNNDFDVVYRTVNNNNIWVVDAGLDRIGVNTVTPGVLFDVNGAAQANSLVVNEAGASGTSLRVEGDTNVNLIFADATNDRVGIGKNNPATILDVNGVITCTNINFGQTNLGHYQENTWTPQFSTSGTVGTPTYDLQIGEYTRIGNFIMCQFDLRTTNWTGSPTGNLRVIGLPFTSKNSGLAVRGYYTSYQGITVPSGSFLMLRLNANSTIIQVGRDTNVGFVDIAMTDTTPTSLRVQGQIEYRI